MRHPGIIAAALVWWWAALLPAAAKLQEAEPGVFVADFEDGSLEDLGLSQRDLKQPQRAPSVMEIVADGAKRALHLKGRFQTRVFFLDHSFGDFVLDARLRKTGGSYGGIVVRDHWRVYLQMKRYLSLNSDAPGLESRGELLKSDATYDGYHRLRVVCAGPLLRAFVDGEPIFQYVVATQEGRIGFYSHGNGELFCDEVRIDTHVPTHFFLSAGAQAEGDALVFSPYAEAHLQTRVANYSESAQTLAVAAEVTSWTGETIRGPVRHEAKVAPGTTTWTLNLGRLPAGFHRLDLRTASGDVEVNRQSDLPLAVQSRGSETFQPPPIPIAAYYKYYNKKTPLHRNTYAHAAARSLAEHNFTAVVSDPSFTRETVDIFQSYGIATISRTAAFIDHPAVIATLVSDEPKPDEIEKLKEQYRQLEAQTDKPITTCLVGDALGLGKEGGPLGIWRELQPRLRCFRWYGIKKSHYGLLHEVKYKPYLPLTSVLRIAQFCSETPYWLVAPSFGKTDHEAYFHNPTPAEILGMSHLALAYGAKGILYWAFQSHGGRPCLVDQKSLQPVDGKYGAAASVAAQVRAHADLFRSLRHAGFDIRCPSPVIEAVPVQAGEQLGIYVVNKDVRNSASSHLLAWAETWKMTAVRDVFGGESLPVERDKEGYLTVPVSLKPGEGKLLITDAEHIQRRK